MAYAELHCHTNFSFLDGASAVDELVEQALALGLTGLAVTDHNGLYGVVRFASAAREAGLRPVIGVEIELRDPFLPDPDHIVVPARRSAQRASGRTRGQGATAQSGGIPDLALAPSEGLPARPRPQRTRLPGRREPVKEDFRGIGTGVRGPHLVLLARDATGYRSLCRLISRANMAGTKGAPRFSQALLAEHVEGLIALSGCRDGELARRLRVGDREGARRVAEGYATLYQAPARTTNAAAAGFALELQHHLLPEDDWLVAETARLAEELGLPTVVTNDVHYALPEGRELHDVVTAIRHGRTLETLADLRRPDGESYLKSEAELLALPPAEPATAKADPRTTKAWTEGLANAGEIAAGCTVDLGFERYRFPGFSVPAGETPFSQLAELCHQGVRKRYHPLTPAVLNQLTHELAVIERTGLAEFFLICWDLMRFARERRIPAQGRGSAADSIVAYVLGITRVDPIRHNLLFERFINEGRTTYPDVDIDFSSERREEVIQYVYETYGPEHTGMVCNIVTYRARSVIREVGVALGFPRPLVDRVAKALETYDSVMVRRDLEADGGFAEFFKPPEAPVSAVTEARGLTDSMGQLRMAGKPAVRSGGTGDDKGGPGDSPASVAWLESGRGTGYAAGAGASDAAQVPPASIDGRTIDPESGVLLPAERRTDKLGRPNHWDGGNPVVPSAHAGSTAGLSDWERWLEFCARMDGFPRHLSIHSGGMLITAAPLIDIAPLERATMPGRVVVQYDKRDVETIKLIKLDLLGLGMLAAIDETVQLIEHDCAVCLDLDHLPEEIGEVFEMLQAADTVGVFQVESRAQMQTLPKSRPNCLDDLVVEVAIIRPGPIQGNAVHPYLRRKQGLEPVTYLHPSLAPILADSLGVILYQEQVMRIAIDVAGFSAADSDGFRRAMGTWRSSREMEKLHARFVDGCVSIQGLPVDDAEELFRRVAGFASFGFAKSHAAAFARTAYESSFLKLFYPAQFLVGLINAQPMGFYPVEVLVNDTKRHGVAVLPVDINASGFKTTTEWVGRPGEPLPDGTGIERRPEPVRSPACVLPSPAARERWSAESAIGWGVRLGLSLVKGIGDEHAELLDGELARGPYSSLGEVVERTGLPEETIEQLIRAGALDSIGRPRRELLWQLREVASRRTGGPPGRAAGRPIDLRLPPTDAPLLPAIGKTERLGDSYAVLSLDPRQQVIELFREALDRLGAIPNSALNEHPPGTVRIGGLVVTRQHPMTAKGTVFLALEDETGMVNVTLWPDAWARLRGVVRRHALLLVDGQLQREGDVVNVIARQIVSLPEVAAEVGGPRRPPGVRQLGYAGMRRVG
ncbi:MAG TPA: PHP domain-containing protein [Candidatus Limnocylindrales bacterium]